MTVEERLAQYRRAKTDHETAHRALELATPAWAIAPCTGNGVRFLNTVHLKYDTARDGWALNGSLVEDSVLIKLRNILTELFPA